MDPASLNNGVATFRWNVLDGHYLYKKRMSFELVSPANASIGAAKMSEGVWEEDAFFGNSEVYRGSAVVELPVSLIANQPEALVRVGYQGCADIGICYPPTYKDVKLVEVMAAAAGATTAGTGSTIGGNRHIFRHGSIANFYPMRAADDTDSFIDHCWQWGQHQHQTCILVVAYLCTGNGTDLHYCRCIDWPEW